MSCPCLSTRSVALFVSRARIARECAPATNAAIARISNLRLLNGLDELANFAMPAEYAASASMGIC